MTEVYEDSKEKLDDATNSVKKLRKLKSEGKINLKQFEELADEYEEKLFN